MGYKSIGQAVVEMKPFMRQVETLLTDDERMALIDFVAHNPDAGDMIRGTGGVRKVRFAAKGKGKRGGVRTIYFLAGEDLPIYLLAIYGKDTKVDLTPEEKKVVRAFTTAIKAQRRIR